MVAMNCKTAEQIERMRKAGQVVQLVLDRMREMIAPGVTTEQLNDEAERICLDHGAACLFKSVPSQHGAGPFPAAICTSVNDEVVHGIPSGREIRRGDIASIDFGVRLDGWCADAARTFIVGRVDLETCRLVDITRNSLAMAVAMVRPGRMWSDVARAIQEYIEHEGFSVIRELAGHGTGRQMWEPPNVPNYFSPDLAPHDFPLREGLVLAVEPMANLGAPRIVYRADGWTIVTRDHKPSAHFENTIAVTADGADVLTDER